MKRELLKIYSLEYCTENFYLEEDYFYLDEDQAMKNKLEPVYEYIHVSEAGSIMEGSVYDDFVEQVLTKEQNPEYFL